MGQVLTLQLTAVTRYENRRLKLNTHFHIHKHSRLVECLHNTVHIANR